MSPDAPLLPQQQQQDQEQGEEEVCAEGSVDYRGRATTMLKSGGFRAATPLLLSCVLISVSLFGVSYNLVLFMVNALGLSSAAAASQVSLWNFAHDLSPLASSYVADRWLGKYIATVGFASIFAVGLLLLAAAAAGPATVPFFIALYVVALGKGFVPSLIAFGAEQFNPATQSAQRSSFFSWYYFAGTSGILIATSAVVYVADRFGFAAAAASCGVAMVGALCLIAAGTPCYRFPPAGDLNSSLGLNLNFGALASSSRFGAVTCVWLGSVIYEALRVQTMALFIQQAALLDTMDGRIPAAIVSSFDPASVLLWTFVLDRILRPAAAWISGKPDSLTLTRRMSTGLFLMTIAMGTAAGLERWRMASLEHSSRRPSVLWQIPQFSLVGASKVFYFVGLIEFLYRQVPAGMKTMGTSLSFLCASAGSLLSGALVPLVQAATGWIPRDLEHGHLDYFFCLLAFLGALNFICFLVLTTRRSCSTSISM